MSAYLSRAGLRCTVLEREIFPAPTRGRVAGSLLPRVFRDLDFLPKMEAAKFPHKYGAAWTVDDQSNVYEHDFIKLGLAGDAFSGVTGEDSLTTVSFGEREQEGVPQKYTYHVDRGKFDQLLLEHSEQLGTDVRFQSTVTDVDFSDPELVRLAYTNGDGAGKHSLTARMVVDASGRRTFLGHKLDLRVRDRFFDQYALHTWFRGYDRSVLSKADNQDDFIFIHFLPLSNSWVWQIPITDEITSVGVVTRSRTSPRRPRIAPDSSGARSKAARRWPLRCATLNSCARSTTRATTATRCARSPVTATCSSVTPPGSWTRSSQPESASRSTAPDSPPATSSPPQNAGDFSRERFQTFETTMTRGVRNWYRFIALYYRLNVVFTTFVRDERYRYDVLKLLQGDVYDEDDPPVLERMQRIVKQVEDNPNHIWHRWLGDLRADDLALTL